MSGFTLLNRGFTAILVVSLFLGSVSSYGQSETADELHIAFANGIDAVEAEETGRAVDFFERVFVDSSSYVDPTHGPVTFWLGHALENEGYPDKARTIYRTGILLMQEQERLHPPLVDAFLHRVFLDRSTASYKLAGDAYYDMLERVGREALPDGRREREILTEHLRLIGLIMPEDAQRQAGLSDEALSPEDLASVDGDVLVSWWRSEDPLPATAPNERLQTHLRRVAQAREQYSHADETSPRFFDVRGDIFVRLGEPDETVEVNFDETRLTDIIYSPEGVHVNLSDFPENEFWSYGSLDRRTYYIFVREKSGDPFTIGRVEDLLPRKLRKGFTRGGTASGTDDFARSRESRQTDRAMKALATLRTIYRQYAPFHPNMANRHDDVANFMMNFEMEQGEMSNTQSHPRVFTQRTMASTRNQDEEATRLREEHTPAQSASFLEEAVPLDLHVRTARFLDEDGTTRTEVYWAPGPEGLHLEEEQREWVAREGFGRFGDYFIEFTALQQTPDYRNRAVGTDRFQIQGLSDTEEATIPPQTFATERGDSTLYHLALQWDQYLVDPETKEIGPKVKVGTVEQDSLRPLNRDRSVLEMSDLKPMVVSDRASPLEDAEPYPFENVTPRTELALYFEVYHLAYSANDRTEYTVEYELQGVKERGALMELIRGEREAQTSVSTTRQGSRRTAEEFILLDLSDWVGDSDLSVTVRVQDEVTGQSTERTLDFRLVSPESG